MPFFTYFSQVCRIGLVFFTSSEGSGYYLGGSGLKKVTRNLVWYGLITFLCLREGKLQWNFWTFRCYVRNGQGATFSPDLHLATCISPPGGSCRDRSCSSICTWGSGCQQDATGDVRSESCCCYLAEESRAIPDVRTRYLQRQKENIKMICVYLVNFSICT